MDQCKDQASSTEWDKVSPWQWVGIDSERHDMNQQIVVWHGPGKVSVMEPKSLLFSILISATVVDADNSVNGTCE